MGARRTERGATGVEWALILLLIGILAISAVTLFGGSVGDMWDRAADGADGQVTQTTTVGGGSSGGGGSDGGGSSGGGSGGSGTTTTTDPCQQPLVDPTLCPSTTTSP